MLSVASGSVLFFFWEGVGVGGYLQGNPLGRQKENSRKYVRLGAIVSCSVKNVEPLVVTKPLPLDVTDRFPKSQKKKKKKKILIPS